MTAEAPVQRSDRASGRSDRPAGRSERPIARQERDLVAALRTELAAIDPARPCDRAAEVEGLGSARADDPVIARLSHRLAGTSTAGVPAWEAMPDHCRSAWLRGTFLSRASLSLAAGRTHLEFVVTPDEAPDLARRLGSIGLPASWRVRRGAGVVTWKSAETVGTFLRRIGAGATLLELEARQVSRALRGELNRVLNAESANLGRAVEAAGRQLAAIDELDASGRLATQPYLVRTVAEARREEPEATLAELGDRLGVHRSAVQRALGRIEWLADHEQDRRRDRRRRRSV